MLLGLSSCSNGPQYRSRLDAALFRAEARSILDAIAAPDCEYVGSARQRISKAELQLKLAQFRLKAESSAYASDFEIAQDDAKFFPTRIECPEPVEAHSQWNSIKRDQFQIERIRRAERFFKSPSEVKH